MASDKLSVRFDSVQALRAEFEQNIANRGLFIPTERSFEVRQRMTVEIGLDFVEGSEPALTLAGEVVHILPAEMALGGATPGVAVQLEASAEELRACFAPFLKRSKSDAKTEVDREAAGRRDARRGAVRVPVGVMPATRPPFEATSRDLSASGILLSMKGQVLPVGEVVRVCLWHPNGEPSVDIDGRVVRQLANKAGRIAAVAIAFDRLQAVDPATRAAIDGLRAAGCRNRLGGIRGALDDLGLATMLQMFGASAPRGTLVVDHAGEQGSIAFAEGQLLRAEVGALEGQDALVEMLGWGDGRFEFEAAVDPFLETTGTSGSLTGAVLAASCRLDEERNAESAGRLFEPAPIGAMTTFDVDLRPEAEQREEIGETESAILELAGAGINVERLFHVIPEPAEAIHASLYGLVAQGILLPR